MAREKLLDAREEARHTYLLQHLILLRLSHCCGCISPSSGDCGVVVLYKAVEEPIRVQCSSIGRWLADVVLLMVHRVVGRLQSPRNGWRRWPGYVVNTWLPGNVPCRGMINRSTGAY